jgi:hypothetical protein
MNKQTTFKLFSWFGVLMLVLTWGSILVRSAAIG